jgi:hypothetical protein
MEIVDDKYARHLLMTGTCRNDPKGVWPETLGVDLGVFNKNHIQLIKQFQYIIATV